MGRFKFAIFALVGVLAASFVARAETVDFSGLASGTAVTNQYSGVVFSLQGGPDSSGPPTTWNYDEEALGNSTHSGYPTASILDITFTSPASGLSFTFDNYGDNGATFYTAYDGATVVSTGNISDVGDFDLVAVAGSGITDLQLNNGTGGDGSWYFGVQELTFTSGNVTATPEPGSFLLFGTGILGMAGMLRRKFLAR